MTDLNIKQIQSINNYRRDNNIGMVVSNEAVIEMIKNDAMKTGKVYPGFEYLVSDGTKNTGKREALFGFGFNQNALYGTEIEIISNKGTKEEKTLRRSHDIVYNLEKAIKSGHSEKIPELLNRIDSNELYIEVEKRVRGLGYKGTKLFSPIEELMYKNLKNDKVDSYDISVVTNMTRKWLKDGIIKGDAIIDANARIAARKFLDGCVGLGTNTKKLRQAADYINNPKGIDSPSTGQKRAVYKKVDDIIKDQIIYGKKCEGIEALLNNEENKVEATHILFVMKNHMDDLSDDYIVDLVVDTIYGIGGNKYLGEYAHKILTRNSHIRIEKYRERAKEIHDKVENSFVIKLPFQKKLIDMIAPYEGLISAIYKEKGISREDKAELLENLLIQVFFNDNNEKEKQAFIETDVEELTKDKFYTYEEDIINDINEHKDDPTKLIVDLIRKVNRDKTLSLPSLFTEGSGMGHSVQGQTGDCWLLAGINAIAGSSEGEKLLLSLLEEDPKTGDYTVNLKGVGEKIVVPKHEIRHSNYMSLGNKKIRIFELAIDKYLKEQGYKGEYKNGSYTDVMDGGQETNLFDIIIGNSKYHSCITQEDFEKIDFNNPKKVFTLSNNGVKSAQAGIPELVSSHAYTIDHVDDEYVYLRNPWRSRSVEKYKKEHLFKSNFDI